MNNREMRVVEHFISINGEGRRAGQLAFFIRFAGCNLACAYCDTAWANQEDTACELYSAEALYRMIKESGVHNVTLTGGEPLLQENMLELLTVLKRDEKLRIEIETNGSVDIGAFMLYDNITFTLDYKTSVSGMEDRMCLANYQRLRDVDTVKFVVGSREDLLRSREIVERYHLTERGCGIYLSPCFGKIEPADMVEFLIEQKWNAVNIQLQLHKYIWNPDKRGV
ncbi:MAG: putative 7-carboxy-7-deazaguanine synthase QueE [Bacteroidales bacterium]|nr:putative 7-carboxy-7-deazaguanine synthase QueE [Bacteroidales bacterium]